MSRTSLTNITIQEFRMKLTSSLLVAAALGAGALTTTPMTASAEIVCTGAVCWHTHERYDYPAEANVVVHPDDWRWGASEHYAWREHEGRGYWRGERWIDR
jgi:hypothetical protein